MKKFLGSFVVDRLRSVINHGVVTHQLEICLEMTHTQRFKQMPLVIDVHHSIKIFNTMILKAQRLYAEH